LPPLRLARFAPRQAAQPPAGLFLHRFEVAASSLNSARSDRRASGAPPDRALFAEVGDRLLKGSGRHAKDAGVGQPEFEDQKQGESNAGGP
jgi:hypothetical protein